MKNKGFTLVELLVTITILGLIAIIAVPSINNIINNSRTKTFNNSVDNFVQAAEYYATKEKVDMPEDIGDTVLIAYSDLQDTGYIKELIDPKTKAECTNSKVVIEKTSAYTYEYKPQIVCENYISVAGFNALQNSDFSNSTEWQTDNSSTTLSTSDNVLSVTGGGTTQWVSVYQNTNIPVTGSDQWYVNFQARITTNQSLSIYSVMDGTEAGTVITTGAAIASPTLNTTYNLSGIFNEAVDFSGNIYFRITTKYDEPAETTADGGITEILGESGGVILINLTKIYTDNGITIPSKEEIDQIIENSIE